MNRHFDFGDIKPTGYFFFVASGLGVLFAFIGGDDSRNFSGFVQWQLQTLLPIGLLITSHSLLMRLAKFCQLQRFVKLFISGIVGSTIFTPLALGIDLYLEPPPEDLNFYHELLDEWLGVTPPVTVAWLLMNVPLIANLKFRQDYAPSSKEPILISESTAEKPGFLASQMNMDQIISISSELHYIDVEYENSHDLVLYSLKKAISEMPVDMGMQVHRSFWVAFKHISAVKRKGREAQVIMKNGKVYPVSRANVQALEQAIAKRTKTPT